MKLLAIDTATENCSVGLSLPGQDVELLEAITPAGHSKLVHGMIRQLLDRHNMEYVDLDGIVVDTGPGSFTGVRIGIGVAQGLAYAAGIPVLGISSLQALAAAAECDYCLSAIDARMQQVYWAIYKCTDGSRTLLYGPLVSDPAKIDHIFAQSLDQNLRDISPLKSTVGAGSGWDTYSVDLGKLSDRLGVEVLPNRFPGAQGLLLGAEQKVRECGTESFESPMNLTATYVRDQIATAR